MMTPIRKLDNQEYALKFIFYSLLLSVAIVVTLGINFLMVPFLLSIIAYYSFHSMIDSLEATGVPRSVGIIILFSILGFAFYWIFNIYIPPAIDRVSPFLTYWSKEFQNPDGNRFSEQIDDLISFDSPLFEKAFPPGVIGQKIIDYAILSVNLFAKSLPDFITILIITPIITFFFLLDGQRFSKYFISLVPNRHFEMALMITHRINRQLTNYLKGVVIQSTIMATISSLGFYFLDMNFFLLFGVFLGIANLIPYLGPAIGLIPPAIYALVTEGNMEAVFPILGIVVFCQLVDNILVQPIVIAKSASLHPILVLIGITVGGNLMGLWGMLVAIPILSVLKVTIGILHRSLKEHGVI
ncbi:MAG: AI-2E family transporter [Leptospira sp.]|nr:AI-2E family transporter [Leptospira sp.]